MNLVMTSRVPDRQAFSRIEDLLNPEEPEEQTNSVSQPSVNKSNEVQKKSKKRSQNWEDRSKVKVQKKSEKNEKQKMEYIIDQIQSNNEVKSITNSDSLPETSSPFNILTPIVKKTTTTTTTTKTTQRKDRRKTLNESSSPSQNVSISSSSPTPTPVTPTNSISYKVESSSDSAFIPYAVEKRRKLEDAILKSIERKKTLKLLEKDTSQESPEQSALKSLTETIIHIFKTQNREMSIMELSNQIRRDSSYYNSVGGKLDIMVKLALERDPQFSKVPSVLGEKKNQKSPQLFKYDPRVKMEFSGISLYTPVLNLPALDPKESQTGKRPSYNEDDNDDEYD